MTFFALAFLCGIILLQQAFSLPSAIDAVLFFLFPCLLIKRIRGNFLKILFGIAWGIAWALWYAHMQSGWTLPNALEGKTIHVTGYIASIPEQSNHAQHFLFSLDHVNEKKVASSLIRLSFKTDLSLRVGDKWFFPVKLKQIHGTANPGGFDYEAWSFQKGIRANGYVVVTPKEVQHPLLISTGNIRYGIDRIRQRIHDRLIENLEVSHTSPWIMALIIGERQGISSEYWQVLRNTGTNHLMAIAGLHIGCVSALVFGWVAWCWKRVPRLVLMLPAQHAGGLAALGMALIYSVMAGFSIPTQRACFMFSILLIAMLQRRSLSILESWSWALIGVLLMNPLSVVTESFWLSFGSVMLIIYGMKGRLSPKGLWWKHARIQWVVAIGLIPLSIVLFQQCSIISFIANSIAIPWVGFLIVPCALFGCFTLLFSAKIGAWLLFFADKMLQGLWIILAYLAHLPWASWYQVVPSVWSIIPACIGTILCLAPHGFPGRWLGVIWLLPFFSYKAATPDTGDYWLTLLDVGQGLSAVVQTKNHILVYDAGPKFNDVFDMGETAVLPFLRTISARKIDMLVVSHGDNDHIGGSGAILKQIPVLQIKTSVPHYFKTQKATLCLTNESWTWDGVVFEFVYPTVDTLELGNDSSCVLRVSNKKHSVLLTGDIEKGAENYLVESESVIKADILVAPHHGSKTSGVDAFIERVHPSIVLFPIGYRNRYHFPHPTIIKKYQNLGALSYDTATHGAIRYYMKQNNDLLVPDLFRETHKHYWSWKKEK